MSWNFSYAILIIFTTIVSYISAILMGRTNNEKFKKIYLAASVLSSLLVLFFYKYFDFLATSLNDIFSYSNIQYSIPHLDLLLPVGISFYTFQTLSYTIDVYKGNKKVENHIGIYALYVSFFPQLVAGPIERSTRLLPQFKERHSFSISNLVEGSKWVILGFFMKLVVADRLSLYVNAVYNNQAQHTGITFLIATIFFAFQIYCDFAGYSNIAIGISKMLGFNLMINFRRPYFASSISEFWHKWHISLSTWFKDYFYIQIGGNRVKIGRWYLNLFLTFLVSGLWHGANWTFVVWGAIHGTYIVIENYFRTHQKYYTKPNKLKYGFKILLTFILVNISWIFFRANSIQDAFIIISKVIQFDTNIYVDVPTFFYGIIGIVVLIGFDFCNEVKNEYLFTEGINYKMTMVYSFLLLLTIYLGVFNGGQFIYFQF